MPSSLSSELEPFKVTVTSRVLAAGINKIGAYDELFLMDIRGDALHIVSQKFEPGPHHTRSATHIQDRFCILGNRK
jgi:hypothetical protein